MSIFRNIAKIAEILKRLETLENKVNCIKNKHDWEIGGGNVKYIRCKHCYERQQVLVKERR